MNNFNNNFSNMQVSSKSINPNFNFMNFPNVNNIMNQNLNMNMMSQNLNFNINMNIINPNLKMNNIFNQI